MENGMVRQGKADIAVGQVPEASERSISQLIGGLMVFGLALGGLAIGYVSEVIQWATTGVLVTAGSVLTVSGVWAFIKR